MISFINTQVLHKTEQTKIHPHGLSLTFVHSKMIMEVRRKGEQVRGKDLFAWPYHQTQSVFQRDSKDARVSSGSGIHTLSLLCVLGRMMVLVRQSVSFLVEWNYHRQVEPFSVLYRAEVFCVR